MKNGGHENCAHPSMGNVKPNLPGNCAKHLYLVRSARNNVVFSGPSRNQKKPAVLSEKACYIHFAHPEDRTTLGSDPSAAVGGYTVRQGLLGSALSFQTPESLKALNPNEPWLLTPREPSGL